MAYKRPRCLGVTVVNGLIFDVSEYYSISRIWLTVIIYLLKSKHDLRKTHSESYWIILLSSLLLVSEQRHSCQVDVQMYSC